MRTSLQPLVACTLIGIAAGFMNCVGFALDQTGPQSRSAAEPKPLRIGSLPVSKVLILRSP